MMMADMVDVPIPRRLHDELGKMLLGSEFRSVPEYVDLVLTELREAQNQVRRSGEEDGEVEKRLKSLGDL